MDPEVMTMTERRPTTTSKGPADWFTGDVWLDALAVGQSAPLAISAVHFSPSARTAWHRHAGGQTLWVLEGEGRVQARGEAVLTIRAGEVITARPNEEHWHGAAADRFMTHLSLAEGEPTWGDHVTDDEYAGP
jgi:quercetin dioxygenase-like cupin family protein